MSRKEVETLPRRDNPSGGAALGDTVHAASLDTTAFSGIVIHDGDSVDLKNVQISPEAINTLDEVMVRAVDGETGQVHFEVNLDEFIELHHFDLPASPDHPVDLVFSRGDEIISSVHLDHSEEQIHLRGKEEHSGDHKGDHKDEHHEEHTSHEHPHVHEHSEGAHGPHAEHTHEAHADHSHAAHPEHVHEAHSEHHAAGHDQHHELSHQDSSHGKSHHDGAFADPIATNIAFDPAADTHHPAPHAPGVHGEAQHAHAEVHGPAHGEKHDGPHTSEVRAELSADTSTAPTGELVKEPLQPADPVTLEDIESAGIAVVGGALRFQGTSRLGSGAFSFEVRFPSVIAIRSTRMACMANGPIILTTIENVPGRTIVEHFGVVTGSTVRSKHFGKDFFAGLKNIVGGEIRAYTELLQEARLEATNRMIQHALDIGANAIVNIRYATTSVASGAAELYVYGTAVRIE